MPLTLIFLCLFKEREAELERTVQELGAALVVAKNRVSSSSALPPDSAEAGENGTSNETVAVLRARVSALSLELETSNANLSLERERVSFFVLLYSRNLHNTWSLQR